ncbi:hypothetical protein HO133_001927 [Letharia lupina]|uniref:Uncharacterized protein n=1 Tax=Letharia lupina TaxID=560253 RepID=A0A8H6FBQ2_9LECA|nr:uncharacterized protein HO133_001927 [Letharia lupina]KAF6221959.1 hypothetical protein HO133_001927 [Letharia lupina]
MAPTLLERRLRSGHLSAVVDRTGYDSSGTDDTGLFGLQDAQETEVGGPGESPAEETLGQRLGQTFAQGFEFVTLRLQSCDA